MLEFFSKLFGKESTPSKTVAKDRLQLVLVHDRASMSPTLLNKIREDIIKVISGYMEIDEKALEVNFCNEENKVALVTNIPVIRMKRDYSAEE